MTTGTVLLQLRVAPALKARIEKAAGLNSINRTATLALEQVFPDPDAPDPRQLDIFGRTNTKRRRTTSRKAKRGSKR